MSNSSIEILIQRSQVLRQRNHVHALALLDEALALASKENHLPTVATIIREKASLHLLSKNYKQALTGYSEALQFYKNLHDLSGQLNCLNDISNIYLKLGDVPSALHYILDSLKLNTEAGDSEGIAHCYNEIGKLYIYLKEYENAVEYFKKSLKIFEGLKNKKEMVNGFFLLGNAYNWLDDGDKALYYLLRAVNSLDQLESTETRAKTLGSLAILYTKTKEYDKALSNFNKALEIADELTNSTVKAQLKKSLGNLYIELTQYDKAIEVLNKALKIAESSPMEAQLVKIHQFLATAYEKIGDIENALEHFKKYYQLDKQVTSDEINLKTKALHIKYDLEELQKQKDIAELSDKLKEQFLANVSHEIRTPMNGVLGMAHLLSKTHPTQEQLEYIDAIKISANNLMVIINDILDFSKINAGKIEFSENEFDLRELVKGILQILRIKAEEKRIQLGCTFDYHIKDNLCGDPIRLNQILTNLMANAVKFTEKGKINLDIKLLEVNESICKIRFKVVDTGIGIPENKLQTIFDSFEQAENNKRRYEGTGLGLTIVKQLVELQGGNIHVKSRVNEGSEFIVEMTFRIGKHSIKSTEAPSHEIPAKLDFSHVRVLIVEDNKVNQLLVKNMLKNFGFSNYDSAENGRTALEKLREENYDLILMDIQMPEMDGYEITREIRSKLHKEVRNIPIIAITADASEKEKVKAKEAGMNDYVVKPYTAEELYASVIKFIPDLPKAAITHTAQKGSSLLRKPGMDLRFMEKFTGGDQELTIQLLEIILKQLPDAVQKLNTYIPKQNWKEVHAISHKMKSSVAIFELDELKKLTTNIEEYSRDGIRLEDIPDLFRKFKQEAAVALLNLQTELDKMKMTVSDKRN
ncbi:MAG: tetratricopeptide repeat protein [Bacteroidia bacterium]|nr:tetratricopeptide repeat protein [Bacteroidia bacterium]